MIDNQQLSNLIHIQQASRENRLVVFAGAGVSMNSGIPSWNELIKSMKSELPEMLKNEQDALKIAQLYKDSRGHKEYMDKVKQVLLYNKAVPNELHKIILELNPCHIITTNYDDLIEQELQKEFILFDIIREDKDIPHMVCQNALIKMHGDFSTDNIVLTENDYYNYAHNFPLIRAYVQSLFASKLVLFVGFSFADLNLKMLMNDLQNILSENMQRAYLLSCDEPDYVTKQYFEKKGINIVYVPEKELDAINGTISINRDLKSIGLNTYKTLFAIKNYSQISHKDLVGYIYNRISPYFNELRCFGYGLRYFFPESERIFWNDHSEGLQTGSNYFKFLKKELKTNQDKRKFLIEHSITKLREFLMFATYNYLFEIDGIKIIDDQYLENSDKYIAKPAIYYLHHFDYDKICAEISKRRGLPLKYTLEDLELPYLLYLLGDYWEAYRRYVELLPHYWNHQKYILYFICRYNIWSIKNGVRFQKCLDKSIDVEKEIELAQKTDLDEVLAKLPLTTEIKKLFMDLITFRSMGRHVAKTDVLREKVYLQRESAKRGGSSSNSNIQVLLSLYDRESVFSWGNCIICDNNEHFKAICHNTASGVLNSFATPAGTMFNGMLESTRIKALNDSMIEMLMFDVDNKLLKDLTKGCEISELKFSEKGIQYINTCLKGLKSDWKSLFVNGQELISPVSNLLFIVSNSEDKKVDVESLYCVILKYFDFYISIGDITVLSIIEKYPPKNEDAIKLLDYLIYNTPRHGSYTQCINLLANQLNKANIEYTNFSFDNVMDKNNKVKELLLVYPVISSTEKEKTMPFLLENINCLYDFMYFAYNNQVYDFSVSRFKELVEKEELGKNDYYYLSKMKRDEKFNQVHGIIDELIQTNDCMQFVYSPLDYASPEKVQIEWILLFEQDMREKLFENPIYHEKLKAFITEKRLSKSFTEYLISLL